VVHDRQQEHLPLVPDGSSAAVWRRNCIAKRCVLGLGVGVLSIGRLSFAISHVSDLRD
jgi:tetrahydromethanopterin S-methyltransferase subunit C